MNELSTIAKQTNNDAILLMIVMIIGIVVIVASLIPMYKAVIKAKKEDRDAELCRLKAQDASAIKREQVIIEVIRSNSIAITQLRETLCNSATQCDACKMEQMQQFNTINNKLDDIKNVLR